MENEKLFELMEKMYADLKGGQDNLRKEISGIKSDMGNLKSDVGGIKSDIRKMGIKLDEEITPKLESLFDGYKQNSEQLTRIEKQVSEHEDVILRKVK